MNVDETVRLTMAAEAACGPGLAAMVGIGTIVFAIVGVCTLVGVGVALILSAWDDAVETRAAALVALRDQEGPHAG